MCMTLRAVTLRCWTFCVRTTFYFHLMVCATVVQTVICIWFMIRLMFLMVWNGAVLTDAAISRCLWKCTVSFHPHIYPYLSLLKLIICGYTSVLKSLYCTKRAYQIAQWLISIISSERFAASFCKNIQNQLEVPIKSLRFMNQNLAKGSTTEEEEWMAFGSLGVLKETAPKTFFVPVSDRSAATLILSIKRWILLLYYQIAGKHTLHLNEKVSFTKQLITVCILWVNLVLIQIILKVHGMLSRSLFRNSELLKICTIHTLLNIAFVTNTSTLPMTNSSKFCISSAWCTTPPVQTAMTRSPAIAEGPRDAGVPVEIW